MRVAVNNYHSDNGVITADAFTISCKEEGQSQTFSDVGAQHQKRRGQEVNPNSGVHDSKVHDPLRLVLG